MIEFLTALLVVITGVYVYMTYKILKSNEQAVRAMNAQVSAMIRPYVHFDLSPHGPTINAVLRNSGQSAAKDVVVRIKPEFEGSSAEKERPIKLTSQTITWLPPGKMIEEFVCTFQQMEEKNPSMTYEGEITYRDQTGNEYHETFVIDYSLRKGLQYLGRPEAALELERIRKELERIRYELQRITSRGK